MKELDSIEICIRMKTWLLVNEKDMQVHSVFANTVNIISEEFFCTLVSQNHCLFPMSCRVFNQESYTGYGIREGMKVIFQGDCLRIPEADLVIDLKNSKERDLSLDKIEDLKIPKDLHQKVELLKELIIDKGSEYDLSTLVTGRFKNPYADYIQIKLPGLNEAIKQVIVQVTESVPEHVTETVTGKEGNPAAYLPTDQEENPTAERAGKEITNDGINQILDYRINQIADQQKVKATDWLETGVDIVTDQAAGIAGCGIGLTPSSDDMLLGYMAAFLTDSKAKGRNLEETYKVTKAMGEKAAERTNAISGAFLKQCGMGLLSEDMAKLMYALYSDEKAETVREYGRKVQNFGSSSGTDMLTGIVLAIENINGGV